MVHKRTAQLLLLAFAAVSVAVEFVGFISPGWLCMSVRYQHHTDNYDMSLLVGNASTEGKSFNTDGDEDKFRRQSKATNQADDANGKDTTKEEEDAGKSRLPLPKGANLSSASDPRQKRLYSRFRKWAQDNKYNLSLPANFIDFTHSLIMYRKNNNEQFFTIKDYLKRFIIDVKNNNRSIDATAIRSLISIGESRNTSAKNPLPVISSTNATIYKEFKLYVESNSSVNLPKIYRGFIKWLGQDPDRIQEMTTRSKDFMQKIANADETKFKQYSAVIRSWFKQALINQENQAAERLGSLALVSGMEWRVKLGLWYGEECVTITGNEQDRCNDTSVDRLEENGFDVGGISTWMDLRVETVFALSAGVVGLVGTILTVKPFCLKGRRRVTLIVGMSGLVLSCILFLLPIVRVASINSTLKNSYRDESEALNVRRPWAAIVSGIGACLACVTAGLLAFFTWADERQKWNKFVDDPPIVFKNDAKENKTDANGNAGKDGTYDNLATIKNA